MSSPSSRDCEIPRLFSRMPAPSRTGAWLCAAIALASIGSVVHGFCWTAPNDAGHVSIPAGTAAIPVSAFDECAGLVSIDIPASVATVGEKAFYKCTNLSAVDWADDDGAGSTNVTVGPKAFFGCGQLGAIAVPRRTSSIGSSAFEQCRRITAFVVPVAIALIADKIFRDCSSLSELTLLPGNTITSVGESAFEGCGRLGPALVLPDTVRELGRKAFVGCGTLASIALPATALTIGPSALPSCLGYGLAVSGLSAPRLAVVCVPCAGVTRLVVPGSVTAIGDYAFKSCGDVTTVVLPTALTAVGHAAFEATGLVSVTLPDSVRSVDTDAFSGCRALSSITIPDGVSSVGQGALKSCFGYGLGVFGLNQPRGRVLCLACAGRTALRIPDMVTAIGSSAFQGCDTVVSVQIPGTVTAVGDKAFQDIGCPDELAFQPGTTHCNCQLTSSWPCSAVPSSSSTSIQTTTVSVTVPVTVPVSSSAPTPSPTAPIATTHPSATVQPPDRPRLRISCYVTSNWTMNQTGFVGTGGYGWDVVVAADDRCLLVGATGSLVFAIDVATGERAWNITRQDVYLKMVRLNSSRTASSSVAPRAETAFFAPRTLGSSGSTSLVSVLGAGLRLSLLSDPAECRARMNPDHTGAHASPEPST